MSFKEELENSKNEQITVIGNYLAERAITDPSVAKNLEKEKKSLSKCFEFIISEAQKLQKGNCAMVKDEVVFGWAVHYYDEDNLKIDNFKKEPVKTAKKPKKATKNVPAGNKTVKQDIHENEQLRLF